MPHYFLGGLMTQDVYHYLQKELERTYEFDAEYLAKHHACTCHVGAKPIVRELHFWEIDVHDAAAKKFELEFIDNYFAEAPTSGHMGKLFACARWISSKLIGRKIKGLSTPTKAFFGWRNYAFGKIDDCMEEQKRLNAPDWHFKCQKCGKWHYKAHF